MLAPFTHSFHCVKKKIPILKPAALIGNSKLHYDALRVKWSKKFCYSNKYCSSEIDNLRLIWAEHTIYMIPKEYSQIPLPFPDWTILQNWRFKILVQDKKYAVKTRQKRSPGRFIWRTQNAWFGFLFLRLCR